MQLHDAGRRRRERQDDRAEESDVRGGLHDAGQHGDRLGLERGPVQVGEQHRLGLDFDQLPERDDHEDGGRRLDRRR